MPKLVCVAFLAFVVASPLSARQSAGQSQQAGVPASQSDQHADESGDYAQSTENQAQRQSEDVQQPRKDTPPHSADRDREAGVSSSRDTRIDISPPRDDASKHPESTINPDSTEPDDSTSDADVQEFHPWDPHKALKDIEVGDFYFKRKNYRAALDRYKEALVYKDNDAMANFRMAQCLEKLDRPDEARLHYENYLKILPHGQLADEAHKALDKLSASAGKGQ
jgi:tetratricopeptide (TPR) repeat protein